MHGLINRSIQTYVTHSYGYAKWVSVTQKAALGFVEFEGMMAYDKTYTPELLDAVSQVLERPRNEIMEDIGAFIVTYPEFEAVRRLLRFSGDDFGDFLHSLDDLDDRVRLAVSDLNLPKVELEVLADGQFNLHCKTNIKGYGYVIMGILRVMADDYGALALLDYSGEIDGMETLSITLVENDFAEGRSFELGVSVG
ncbi:MAG: heme NO-binding domain-containing protein [Sulfitobacter sp.]